MEIPNGHHQAMVTHQLEETLLCPGKTQQQQERKIRSHPEQALKCPRCASTNTKFCYYNNYSLSQPRYFCKGCRRYWTQGGSLRNVPVGGGCRKNKRSSSSSSKKQEPNPMATNSNPIFPPNLIAPPLSYDPSDLTLAFASLQKQPPAATAPKHPGQMDSLDNHDHNLLLEHANTEPIPTATNGFLDILRSGFVDTTGTSGFNSLYHSFGMNGNAEAGGVNVGGEEGVISSVAGLGGATGNTMTSEESCKDLIEGETKMLMGLPWQVAGGDENIAVDSGRDYWTTVGSSWHGLVNSSLM